jgi:RNA polymerase sigma-70 factor (ECF subfamily)
MKVAANTCLTFINQSAKNKLQSADLIWMNEEGEEIRLEIEDKKVNLQEDLEKKEIEEKVRRQMLKLPRNHRLALYFYFWEDLSYDEIAKIMEVPLNTVRTNIKRGKERLEKVLGDLV